MGTIFDWYLTRLRGSAIVARLVASQVNLFSTVVFTSQRAGASPTAWRWYWRSTEEAIALA
jgi:hypothetical protein